jgi:hypothetical protein
MAAASVAAGVDLMRHLLDEGVVGVGGDSQQPLQLVHMVAVVRGELQAMP